ncbi:MAG: beta-glucosidase [Clostridia bacterium]|nr:beta-glucosidase [Bacillota bacterium]MBO2521368.1 beta-glucosidase [Bacillota bacterium]
MEECKVYRFPEGFVWGAATASYQIEGSPLADGAGESIWHRFSHTEGNTHNGETGDVACDHYRRYREDVALMKELGLKAYRFSISWPRVLPEGKGRINPKGLDFYDRLVDELLENGIEPFATIYHWDLPGALHDLGGWINPEIEHWFADYAAVLFLRLGDRVKRWITLNEPWCSAHLGYVTGHHAPGLRDQWAGLRAAHHLLLAHAAAVEVYRASGLQGQIGITVNINATHAGDDAPETLAVVRRVDTYNTRFFLEPLFKGSYPEELAQHFGRAWPKVTAGDLERIAQPMDFLGINYYTRLIFAKDPATGTVRQVKSTAPYTDMGWEVYPEGLYEVLKRVHEMAGPLPLYVTENGAAFPDRIRPDGTVSDPERTDYLRQHFIQAHRCIQDGIPLAGYFVWSLMDNFEWAFGYSKRFGVVHVDFETQKRTVKESGRFFSRVIAQNGLDAES